MAIAYDSSSSGDWFSGLTCNYNFNNVAGDYLLVMVESGGGTGNIQTPSYAGVAMSSVGELNVGGNQILTLWDLISPATGVNVVACSRTTNVGSGLISSFPLSLSGTRLSLQPEVFTTTTAPSVADFNANVVTLTANAMHVSIGVAASGVTITGTDTAGATMRATQLLGGRYWFTKPGPGSPGSDNIHMLGSASSNYWSLDVSIAQFGAVPPGGMARGLIDCSLAVSSLAGSGGLAR